MCKITNFDQPGRIFVCYITGGIIEYKERLLNDVCESFNTVL